MLSSVMGVRAIDATDDHVVIFDGTTRSAIGVDADEGCGDLRKSRAPTAAAYECG